MRPAPSVQSSRDVTSVAKGFIASLALLMLSACTNFSVRFSDEPARTVSFRVVEARFWYTDSYLYVRVYGVEAGWRAWINHRLRNRAPEVVQVVIRSAEADALTGRPPILPGRTDAYVFSTLGDDVRRPRSFSSGTISIEPPPVPLTGLRLSCRVGLEVTGQPPLAHEGREQLFRESLVLKHQPIRSDPGVPANIFTRWNMTVEPRLKVWLSEDPGLLGTPIPRDTSGRPRLDVPGPPAL